MSAIIHSVRAVEPIDVREAARMAAADRYAAEATSQRDREVLNRSKHMKFWRKGKKICVLRKDVDWNVEEYLEEQGLDDVRADDTEPDSESGFEVDEALAQAFSKWVLDQLRGKKRLKAPGNRTEALKMLHVFKGPHKGKNAYEALTEEQREEAISKPTYGAMCSYVEDVLGGTVGVKSIKHRKVWLKEMSEEIERALNDMGVEQVSVGGEMPNG